MGDRNKQESWLELVLSKATELRSVGVESIAADGCAVCLLPAEPEPEPEAPTKEEVDAYLDPLDDPSTYGRRRGVPGYGKRWKEEG